MRSFSNCKITFLIGREPFLTITWEPGFSQACSFRRMLMNLKNFHLTQIPDKTNDMIQKPFFASFLTILVILPNRDVFQKIQLSHITIDGPLTACWVSEKNNEPIPRKLTYRWKDEQKDRHTLFFRTIMVASPLTLGGIWAKNWIWRGPKFKGRPKILAGAYEPPWCHGCCVKRYSFMFVRF